MKTTVELESTIIEKEIEELMIETRAIVAKAKMLNDAEKVKDIPVKSKKLDSTKYSITNLM